MRHRRSHREILLYAASKSRLQYNVPLLRSLGTQAGVCPKTVISEMTVEESPTESFTRVRELIGFDLCGVDSIRGKSGTATTPTTRTVHTSHSRPPPTPTLCSGYNARVGSCSCGDSSSCHLSTPTTRTDSASHSIPTQSPTHQTPTPVPPRGRSTHATVPPPTPFVSDDSWVTAVNRKDKKLVAKDQKLPVIGMAAKDQKRP